MLWEGAKFIFSFGGISVVYIFLIHGSFLAKHRARHVRGVLNPCSPYYGYRPSRLGVYAVVAYQAHFHEVKGARIHLPDGGTPFWLFSFV